VFVCLFVCLFADIAENFVHTLYDAISTEMYAHTPAGGLSGDGSDVGAPTEQSVLDRLNSFAGALETLTNQINRINQTLTILEVGIIDLLRSFASV
jgi:hypothetical protein